MRRRAAIEPVISHLKQDHRMGRNYLTGRDGNGINAVLAAAGYNFSLLLRWFEELLRVLSLILCHAPLGRPASPNRCRKTFFTADAKDVDARDKRGHDGQTDPKSFVSVSLSLTRCAVPRRSSANRPASPRSDRCRRSRRGR